jgi:hypothetical protein
MNHTLKDYALALQILGARVEISQHSGMVIATHRRAQVNFWISDKYGLFGVGEAAHSEAETIYSFQQIREILGLTGYIRSSTILTRAMKSLGLSNKRDKSSLGRDFHIHGEYNDARERVRTVLDFDRREAGKTVAEHWAELKGGLDLTGYSFELHDCHGAFYYVSN